nr:hypothetical protein [uncultured Desulfuromonas sp.]
MNRISADLGLFEDIHAIDLPLILKHSVSRGAWFAAVGFLVGSITPSMTTIGQHEAAHLLLEHVASSSFNILGSWAWLSLSIYVAAKGREETPSQLLRNFAFWPANSAFTFGVTAIYISSSYSIGLLLFGPWKSFALGGLLKSFVAAFVLYLFVRISKEIYTNKKLEERQHRYMCVVFALITFVASVWEYASWFSGAQ